MSSLTTEFAARYSTKRIVELTNADDQSATTSDATRLAQAAADATIDFETICGVTLDTDDPAHTRIAVLFMEALLLEWGSGTTPESAKVREKAQTMAERLAKVTGRNRIVPTSSSNLEPSTEPTTRPYFDRERTAAIRLEPPLHPGGDTRGDTLP